MLKILFKPIKWILGIILGIVIMIAIPIALLYKSVTPPTTSEVEIDLEEYIYTEVDHLIDPENEDKSFSLTIDENTVNNLIYEQLVLQFGESENPNYLYEDENVMFQGAWVEFREDTVNIIAAAHADARIFTFKTRVLTSFKIIEDQEKPGELILRLDKFKIGNLSLRWVLRVAPKLAERFIGQDIDSFIEQTIGDFATYNGDKLELSINIYDLTKHLEENKELGDLLIDLIYGNDLLELGVFNDDDEYKLGVKLNLNKVKDDSANYVLPESEKINTEEEFNNFLYNKALSGIISSNNAIRFNNLEMNKIIDYIFKQSSEVAADYLMRTKIYQEYEAIIGNPYLEISEDLVINVPIEIGKDSKFFKTKFKLSVVLNVSGDDLIIEFKNGAIGQLTIDNNNIDEILSVAGQEDIIESRMLVEDFFTSFEEAGIEITNIEVINNKILFYFEGINVNNILDDIKTSINNPALNDKVDEIIDKIDNSEEITEEDVEELLEIFENFTEEELQDIQDIINNYLNQ